MDNCPACGSRLWPTVDHRQTHEELPAFATVRWGCRQCGWSAEDTEAAEGGQGEAE